jgi:membrane protease YdiL (CAAX protease family)
MSLRSGELSDSIELDLPPKKHLFYTNGLVLIIGAAIILTIWNGYWRPWSSLGICWALYDIKALYAVVAISIFYVGDIVFGIINDRNSNENDLKGMAELLPTNTKEYGHYTFLAFAAGICEEIMFRGFLIPYLMVLAQPSIYASHIAVLVPATAFAINHMYQGWKAIGKIVIVSVLLGYIFLWTESLLVVVIIHVLIDLISGFVGMITVNKRLKEINDSSDE